MQWGLLLFGRLPKFGNFEIYIFPECHVEKVRFTICAISDVRVKMQAKAYVVDSQGAPFVLRDVLLDSLQPSEVLVEIKFTGLCHTVGFVLSHGAPG
jgi:hypothetical protein